MEDKKNENQKIMKYMSTKLKEGQISLMLQDIILFYKSNSQQAKLVITSSSLYFLQNGSLKKYFKATLIQCIILTPYSNEMVIFYDSKGDQTATEALRLQSQTNFKIIQDIISVRQRFCQMKQLLTVMVSPVKSLQALAHSGQNSGKSIFGFLFKKKQDKFVIQRKLSGQGQILLVSHDNFAIQIGQKMYSQIYKNIKLLYISSSENFRFFQQKYNFQQITPDKKIFRQKKNQNEKQKNQSNVGFYKPKKNILLRKIGKRSPEDDKLVAQALIKYRNQQYKQQLLFALQTETHFQVLTAVYQDQRDCQTLLLEHQFLSQKDLKSIFFKLIQMVESSHQIFYSLSPDNIIISKDGIKISKIFSCLRRRIQLEYLAPEELIKQQFSKSEIQLLNLWKIGILLFQLAYGNVPFPVQYIAELLIQQIYQVQLRFPFYSLRTLQFQQFIRCILKIQPNKRGIADSKLMQSNDVQINWKTQIMKLNWLK